MKKGILKTAIFYSIGLLLTVLTYLAFGPGYLHGPGPFIFIPFLTVLIGLFWTGSTIFSYFFKNKTDERKGLIYSQLTVFVLVIGTVFYLRNEKELHDSDSDEKYEIVADNKGDSTTISYNGQTIYLKVKDSVHFDKRDSLASTMK
jgi:hypothetical protein